MLPWRNEEVLLKVGDKKYAALSMCMRWERLIDCPGRGGGGGGGGLGKSTYICTSRESAILNEVRDGHLFNTHP